MNINDLSALLTIKEFGLDEVEVKLGSMTLFRLVDEGFDQWYIESKNGPNSSGSFSSKEEAFMWAVRYYKED